MRRSGRSLNSIALWFTCHCSHFNPPSHFVGLCCTRFPYLPFSVDKDNLSSVLGRRLASLQAKAAAEEPRRHERQRRQAAIDAQLQQSQQVQKRIFDEQMKKVR